MQRHHELVSNSKENSVLAAAGSVYIVYILNDNAVTVDLGEVRGMATVKTYNPRTGQWSSKQSANGGSARSFTKPANSDDWVLYILSAVPDAPADR